MRVSISPKAPLICNDLFCGLTDQPINSMYLSFGKGDWKDYATLRLADPKFS